MKKTLCLILALVLVIGIFAGCGEKPTNSQIEVYSKADLKPEKIGDYGKLKLPFANGENIEILISTNSTNLSDRLITKELEKRTGVDIVITEIPTATQNQKVSTIIASGELPEIMNAGTQANKVGPQGAFVALDEYIDLMPNFKKFFGFHEIFHIFVILGSIFHFSAVYIYTF